MVARHEAEYAAVDGDAPARRLVECNSRVTQGQNAPAGVAGQTSVVPAARSVERQAGNSLNSREILEADAALVAALHPDPAAPAPATAQPPGAAPSLDASTSEPPHGAEDAGAGLKRLDAGAVEASALVAGCGGGVESAAAGDSAPESAGAVSEVVRLVQVATSPALSAAGPAEPDGAGSRCETSGNPPAARGASPGVQPKQPQARARSIRRAVYLPVEMSADDVAAARARSEAAGVRWMNHPGHARAGPASGVGRCQGRALGYA